MQSSILEFFKTKKTKVQPTSPLTKKATAIRSLKRVSKRDADEDFVLELSEESDDEKEFDKVVSKEKAMRSNKLSDSDDWEQLEPEPEPEKPTKKKVTAPKKKASSPSPQVSSSSSMESLATVSDEAELPKWLTTDLRDKNGARPGDSNYDPTTVLIPKDVKASFTPFQKQFWAIKENNFDAIVMIRKGKFYEMFSTDAVFARDVLKLRLTARGKEPMCGVPEKAFAEWALKIINAGRRVCKVEQMETAIDQKNREGEKTIRRKLVQIYSSGTIDDYEMLESSQPSYLMSLRSSAKNTAGVCLVDCSTGSFHLGVVNEDDLTDVLIRFEPVEVVFNRESLCPEHLEIVKTICGNGVTHSKTGAEWWDGQLALNQIQRTAKWDDIPEELEKFPTEAIAALGGCVAYLKDHKIAKSLLSLKRFSSLDEAGGSKFLALDSSALTNLQIIGKDEHCLINIIDKCVTPFGKRRLRFWAMHPLRNLAEINDRLDAVDELMDAAKYAGLSKKMQALPDLERILSRVYANRCGVRVFLDCLQSLSNAAELIASLESKVEAPLLKRTVKPGMASDITKLLNRFNSSLEREKSLNDNEFVVKKGVFQDIDDIDNEVKSIEQELDSALAQIRKELHCKDIEFSQMQNKRYEVEIPARIAAELGDKYRLMSQTKTIRRFRTPEIDDLVTRLENVENERQKLRAGCQKRFVDDFASNSELLDATVNALAELDCLLSLAAVSNSWTTKCRPKFVSKDSEEANGKALLSLKTMSHPSVVGCIPNDVLIRDKYVLIITGPNASGKSTFARMCCIAIVLAQIGCYLPAVEATLTIYDQIFTRIGAGDRLFSGQSTFGVELSETARLMSHATEDSFVVLDELGRGTSTFDGIAIATAVLEHFIEQVKCPLVFCTHYHVLTQQFQPFPMVRNASMKYAILPKEIKLLHKIVDGPCSSSFGCEVAKICGLPEDITKEAQEVANDFEARHKALHVNTSECQVEVIEVKPEYRTIADALKAALGKATTREKSQEIGAIAERIQQLDLS